MIRHYLQAALANIGRTPFTTAANILTLALGLVCFLAAYGIVTYWTAADSYHRDADRIGFVSLSVNAPNATRPTLMNQVASPALARPLKEDFPEIETVVRLDSAFNTALAAGDRKILTSLAYADTGFTDVFDIDFDEGDARTALATPTGIVLTRETARQLFGSSSALGRAVIVDGREDVTVTGVIAPIRQPSFMGEQDTATLRFHAIRPWQAQPDADQMENGWLMLRGFTVFKLKPGATLESVRSRLTAFLDRRLPPAHTSAAKLFIDVFPISRMGTLGIENTISPTGGSQISVIVLILGLGLLTLTVACVNYANLATAQALVRAKEVGMRKTLGASSASIMLQAWTETTLLSFAAFLVALAVLFISAPALRAYMGVDPMFVWSAGPAAILAVVATVALTAFLAGAYPAFRLSRARPADALRAGRSRTGSLFISKTLVIIQFISASFLLIMVTVVQLQRNHSADSALSGHADPIVVLNPVATLGFDFETLDQRLRQSPAIKDVTAANFRPWGWGLTAVNIARTTDPGANAPALDYRSVDYSWFSTLNLNLLAGRVFSPDRDGEPALLYNQPPTRTPPIVIDEIALPRLGFATAQEAVGKIVYVPESLRRGAGQSSALPVEIIGVVSTEISTLEASPIAGHVYAYGPKLFGGQIPVVRIARDRVDQGIAHITRIWNELSPNVPLNLRFFDELFEQRYRTHTQVGGLFMLLAGTAFFISTVGLLGIAVHAASRRRHEIAVRKTLGSSVIGIIRLLLTDFSIPVLIGNLMAWPIGYMAANAYLAAFSDRIDLTPAPFALSLLITLFIAWAAIIGVVIRAASVRPAEVLRRA